MLLVRNRGPWAARWLGAIAMAIALGFGVVSQASANTDDGGAAVGGVTTPDFAIGQQVVVATDRLNLRAEPGVNGEVVIVLEEGQVATVVDGPSESDGYVWYQLDAEGTVGWSAGNFLAASTSDAASGDGTSDTNSDVSGALSVGGETSGTGSALGIGTTVAVTDDRVNLRADPGLDAEILDQLSSGTSATVLDGPVDADGYSWYQLDVDGVTGWVAGEFLAAA